MTEGLRVTEVFLSIQGESRSIGWPTVFVRLTGCPLRCVWCDTGYAFHGGERLPLDALVAEVLAHGVRHVTITGGEPLAQPATRPLLQRLAEAGLEVSLETSGALDIAGIDPRVSIVMDLKAPGSGECERNLWSNLDQLAATDQVKIVIAGAEDYRWAREVLARHGLTERCEVILSPAHGMQDPTELAEWILRDRLPVRFQVQLHKLLWGEARGR